MVELFKPKRFNAPIASGVSTLASPASNRQPGPSRTVLPLGYFIAATIALVAGGGGLAHALRACLCRQAWPGEHAALVDFLMAGCGSNLFRRLTR